MPRKAWLFVRPGPEPLLDADVIRTLELIDHVGEDTAASWAIVEVPDRVPETVYDASRHVRVGLVFTHIEDLGPSELSYLSAALSLLMGRGLRADIEYADLWWEKALVEVIPIDPYGEKEVLRMAREIVDSSSACYPLEHKSIHPARIIELVLESTPRTCTHCLVLARLLGG